MTAPVDKQIYELLNKAKPAKHRSTHVIFALYVLAALAAVGISAAAYARITAPTGRITAPAPGAETGRVVAIEGFTKRLPPDRNYLWVVVDVPAMNRCWPKRRIETVNGPFATKIHEQGPHRRITVSLYAVNRDYHQRILDWREDCRLTGTETGLALLPEVYRLHTFTITLKET